MSSSTTKGLGARYLLRRLRRFCDSATDVGARSALLHLDEAAVNGPSFCCRVSDDSARNVRIDSHTLNRYSRYRPRLSTKSNGIVAQFDEKNACA
jgi:hypothetical protein